MYERALKGMLASVTGGFLRHLPQFDELGNLFPARVGLECLFLFNKVGDGTGTVAQTAYACKNTRFPYPNTETTEDAGVAFVGVFVYSDIYHMYGHCSTNGGIVQ